MHKKPISLRRKVSRMLITFLMLSASIFTTHAQVGYECDASCFGNVLNISTGYNQGIPGYNSPLSIESNWTLTAAPAASGVTIPAPCWDIPGITGWSNGNAPATWVSPFQSASYNINNWNGSTSNSEAFEFEKCFCVCHESMVDIDFELLADDYVEVFLDGVSIGSGFTGYHFQWANRISVHNSYLLSPGQHCLTVKLYNAFGVAMGFSLAGTVTGGDLLTSACCNPEVKICGTKVRDLQCDGEVDLATDQGLSGWTILLEDNWGNNIGSAITDEHGNYCFVGLTAGTYVVSEVNQPGWTQSYPSTPGTWTLALNPGETGSAIFGNCEDAPPPCSFDLAFDGSIMDCGINMTPVISGMPAGYHVVSYAWNFGDGSGSDNEQGIHYYNSAGHYVVCLTVTIYNGHECCTKKFCREISIKKPCTGGCEFTASYTQAFNPITCEYSFDANVTFAGAPITGWYWEFGDGTTATGPSVNHTFPSAGSYNVCLTLFANIDGRCCFYKVCRELAVSCDPGHGKMQYQEPNTHASSVELGNKNVVVLDQNVPNPFAESTVISYNIPNKFGKAQLKFMNINGTVIKSVDITRTGKGEITVYANDLTSGMYIYSLVIDDKIIDSKRMVKN